MNGRMNRIEDRLDRVMESITELDKRLTKVEIKLGIEP
jgi:replication fork clamp-binding protein CrfC